MNAVRAIAPLHVNLQVAADDLVIPDGADWEAWVGAALLAGGHAASGAVTVRLVAEDESAGLNSWYRGKPLPTNVLSFAGPGEVPAIGHCNVAGDAKVETELGDLVICFPVASREADEQGKPLLSHLAHLVVHGTLHLIGYDHRQAADAERMESLEIQVLSKFGFTDPYAAPYRTND